MDNKVNGLDELYKIFLEVEKCSELIGEEKLSDYVHARLDLENESVFLTENDCENELDFIAFKINLGYIMDGLDELISCIELDEIYSKFKSGEMTEEQFVTRAGRITLAQIILDELSDKLQEIEEVN